MAYYNFLLRLGVLAACYAAIVHAVPGAFLTAPSASSSSSVQSGLSDAMIANVKVKLEQIATRSWEIGTELETLIELEWPDLSVFGGHIPPNNAPQPVSSEDVLAKAVRVVKDHDPNASGPLIDGQGSVGDPASIGVGVLLANWTRTDLSDQSYAQAASNQLNYLLNVAPRTQDGAISHRADQVQLWADFVYMAPPFIAYYGALQGGSECAGMLKKAYAQCKLYRSHLRDGSGLWQHIVLGNGQDNNHWGTGNAWAAAGMLRVLETIQRSECVDDLHAEKADLSGWIGEILDAAWSFQAESGALFNYIDQPASSFPDSSATALLAAVSYRMATFRNDLAHIPAADKAFEFIKSSLTEDGWLAHTVDPLAFNVPSNPGSFSPEGQAFVLLLEAAWRDFHN